MVSRDTFLNFPKSYDIQEHYGKASAEGVNHGR
jgi:hypothetical protein